MKITLTEEQKELLQIGSIYCNNREGSKGEQWFYLPYWFKWTEESNEFEMIYPEKLPEYIRKLLEEKRK